MSPVGVWNWIVEPLMWKVFKQISDFTETVISQVKFIYEAYLKTEAVTEALNNKINGST